MNKKYKLADKREAEIVGIHYYEGEIVVGEPVRFYRELDNQYDPNAIKVINESKEQVGYLDRQTAKILAPLMDDKAIKLRCEMVGQGDWLGTGAIATRSLEMLPFEQARKFVRGLNLKSEAEWRAYYSGKLLSKGIKPSNISTNPHRTYAGKGWINMGDWLGTFTVAARLRNYLPYKRARNFVRELNLKSRAEWNNYCHGKLPDKGTKPVSIPTAPNIVYEGKGWVGMGDWLGTKTIAPQLIKFRPFKQAREFVHRVKLKNTKEWRDYCKGKHLNEIKKPDDIPANPDVVYKDKGWTSVGDWLGTGAVANQLKIYLPFTQARKCVREFGLKSEYEWKLYCRGLLKVKWQRPDNIPRSPYQVYKGKGWISWPDWLGTENKKKKS